MRPLTAAAIAIVSDPNPLSISPRSFIAGALRYAPAMFPPARIVGVSGYAVRPPKR